MDVLRMECFHFFKASKFDNTNNIWCVGSLGHLSLHPKYNKNTVQSYPNLKLN
jgi:hypothetical protein